MTDRSETGLAEPCTTETRLLSRQTLLLAILLAELVPLAIWSVVLCHEILGHLLTAVLFGGTIRGVHVDLRGTAEAFYSLDGHGSRLAHIIISLSGTIITLILGTCAALLAPRLQRKPVLAWFCILFAICGIMSALIYATFGLVYVMGDFSFVGRPQFHVYRNLALVTGLSVLPAAYFLMRTYARLQSQWFSVSSDGRRILLTALTLGLGFAVFGIVTFGAHVIADWLSRNAAQALGFAVDSPGLGIQLGERVLPISVCCVLAALGAGMLGLVRARQAPFHPPDWLRAHVLAWPALPLVGYSILVPLTGGDARISGPGVYRGHKQDVLLTRRLDMCCVEADGRGRICSLRDAGIDAYDPRTGETTPLLSGLTEPRALQTVASRLYFAESGRVRYFDLDTTDTVTILAGRICSAFCAGVNGDLFYAEDGRRDIYFLSKETEEPHAFATLPEPGGNISALARLQSGDLLTATKNALYRISPDGKDFTKIEADVFGVLEIRELSKNRAILLDDLGQRLMLLELDTPPKAYELVTGLFDSMISGVAVWDETTVFYTGYSFRPSLPSPYFLRVLKIDPASPDRSVRSDGS